MNNSSNYVIECWPHGWLICAPEGQRSIPCTALAECSKLFPKKAVMANCIAHHFNTVGHRNVVVAVATPLKLGVWRTEINHAIAELPPEERWWKGLDVGTSSAAIFAVFSSCFSFEAYDFARVSVPCDADDFGRCTRLLALFPKWREELHRVADAYPETKWPILVARWAEIEAEDVKRQTGILRALTARTP